MHLSNNFFCLTALSITLIFSLRPDTNLIYPSPQNDIQTSHILAPGIEHLEIHRTSPGQSLNERWIINVLIVSPNRGRLKLVRAMDELVGTETTSSLATRFGAIAAINAGYFRTAGIYRGEPNGIFYLNGKLLSEDFQHRAALVFSANHNAPNITHVSSQTKLVFGKSSQTKVHGINRPRGIDEIIIFTPELHRTTLTNPDGDEYMVNHHRIVSIYKNQGSSSIPDNGFVISVSGKMRNWAKENLKQGMKITISNETTFDQPISFSPVNIVGGGPQLLRAGKILTDSENFNQVSFINQRHPRTAYGKRADGSLVLVTVDGRQPQKSVGMTIPELTQLMIALGCVEALNLDGGGSTTMVINNKVVNNVSDATGERPISDAILIFSQ